MIVSDVCNHDVITIEKNKSLSEAAKLMREHHVGDVVVVEKKDNKLFPLGIVTDRDVVIEVVATELDPEVITTGDIMLQTLVVVKEDADLLKTSKLMASKGVRRLPVVSKSGELVGIVTLDDLLEITASIFMNLTKSLSNEQKNEFKSRR
jgi:CBS domain-containing protein